MTITDILAGNPTFIMRSGWSNPIQVQTAMLLGIGDLMATDWQLPPKQATLTRGSLQPVWNSIVAPHLISSTTTGKPITPDIFTQFCQAIGVDTQ